MKKQNISSFVSIDIKIKVGCYISKINSELEASLIISNEEIEDDDSNNVESDADTNKKTHLTGGIIFKPKFLDPIIIYLHILP